MLRSDDRAESRAIVNDLLKLAHQNPQLARARAALVSHADDIIDGADMIKLAERELMAPLDRGSAPAGFNGRATRLGGHGGEPARR